MKILRYLISLFAAAYMLSSSVQIMAQAPVPPPVEQNTADCAMPTYASDQLVCSDDRLRELDKRLKLLLAQGLPQKLAFIQESDEQWFKRRSRCAFEDEHQRCLGEAYADRLAIIQTDLSDIGSSKHAKCKNLEKVRRVKLRKALNGNVVIIQATNERLIGVATPILRNSVWKPALSYMATNQLFEFRISGGTAFWCKLE